MSGRPARSAMVTGPCRSDPRPTLQGPLSGSLPDSDDLAVVARVLDLSDEEVCDVAGADALVAAGEGARLLGVVAGARSVLDAGATSKDVVQGAGGDGVESALMVGGGLKNN